MKMYCKWCKKNTKQTHTKDKRPHAIYEEYRCKECGSLLWIISETRRKR